MILIWSFEWILAVFHRVGFHTSIVMLWEKQSRRSRICTQISKTSTPRVAPMYSPLNKAHALKVTHRILFHRARIQCLQVYISSDLWPIKMRMFHHLAVLDLSHNVIRVVPRLAFWNMTNLFKLDLSHNRIIDIPFMWVTSNTHKGILPLDA